MSTNHDEPTYSKEELKIAEPARRMPFLKDTWEEKVEETEITWMDGAKTIFLLLFGYAFFSALPTFLLMKFADTGFFLSQAFVLLFCAVLVLVFGLHKEASPEQLAKRDIRKKR